MNIVDAMTRLVKAVIWLFLVGLCVCLLDAFDVIDATPLWSLMEAIMGIMRDLTYKATDRGG
jgi:hypothetical protein